MYKDTNPNDVDYGSFDIYSESDNSVQNGKSVDFNSNDMNTMDMNFLGIPYTNPVEVKMPTYKNGQERKKRIVFDTANYYNMKYRKNVDYKLAEKVYKKINVMRNPDSYIANAKLSKPSMKNITVAVWQIGKNGKKYTKNVTITVLKEIAPDVQAIFKEIYNGKEKFPINEIDAYAARDVRGFHPLGLAIDINPTYNPQFQPDGVTPIVGSKYDPKKYPQSIGADADVLKAFGKRGWTWGASFNKPDVMHFSYLE